MPPTESALIVPVPEAEPVVARAAAVRLLIGGGGEPWTTAAEFPLG